MDTSRISASSYSNTAPLVWSFLYGKNHGHVELILDNAPARSAELLAQDRVDAALVPVIAYQMIKGTRLIQNVCVGAKERVRSVCLITKGEDLSNVKSVALDVSSKTSVVLTKIIFREFLGFEPIWTDDRPDIEDMLKHADAALLIGDPALALSVQAVEESVQKLRIFDLAELWHQHTGFGFVFAMWMTRHSNMPINFADARDEGILHIDDIAANYASEIGLDKNAMKEYLSSNISYSPDESMQKGMKLYFELAHKNRLIESVRPPEFL